MPDVKPRPSAGAMRRSLTRADQNGTRSLSISVACIPDPCMTSGSAIFLFDALSSREPESTSLENALVEDASGVDDDGLAGHGLGAAHRDHHVGAVVLVGRLLQQRRGRGALDLLGLEVSCRARALQQARRHAVD